MTCWFDDDGDGGWVGTATPPTAVQRALACALAMQQSMQQFAVVRIAGAADVTLAIKVAVAAGPVVRYVVGDPDIQSIDVMAGADPAAARRRPSTRPTPATC